MRNRAKEKEIIAAANPIRYFTDGRPYVIIGGMECTNHPIIDKLAEMDRLEKYVLPNMKQENAELSKRIGQLESELFQKMKELQSKEVELVQEKVISICKPDWEGYKGWRELAEKACARAGELSKENGEMEVRIAELTEERISLHDDISRHNQIAEQRWEKIRELTAALEYYADVKIYFGGNTAKVLNDAGRLAKETLQRGDQT